MNFFKKIDQYLLHQAPSIWITRVHIFLPIGIGAILLIHLLNLTIGWNPKNDLPDAGTITFLMTIPILIYLVYWFIFQSRYNVSKSGGKMNIWEEYLNLILYALVLFVAYLFFLVAPVSNDYKVMMAVPKSEFKEDLIKLDRGDVIMNGGYFEELSGNRFEMIEGDFLDDYWYYDYYYDEPEKERGREFLTRREVLMRIDDYMEVYNKYHKFTSNRSAEGILADRLSSDYSSNDYNYYDNDGYKGWDFERKISRLKRLHEGATKSGFNRIFWYDSVFWKVSIGVLLWLAMLIWIFKQMNLRHFVFGFISLCLTPLAVGLVGVIIFGLLLNNYTQYRIGEDIAIWLILFVYLALCIITYRGYMKDKLSQSAYVISMYVHFWFPGIPFFIFMFITITGDRYSYYYGMSEMQLINFIYWSTMIVGLASIAIFKPIYTKFRNLPAQK